MRTRDLPGGRHRRLEMPFPLRLLALPLAAALGLGACSGSPPGTGEAEAKASNPPPAGLPAFYATPRHLPGGPGTLIKSQRLASPGVDGSVYQVMYVSEDEQGDDIPVVGTVTVPRGPVPAGGFPVLTYAHPTIGMAPNCSDLLHQLAAGNSQADFTNPLLRKGFEFAVSELQPAGKTLPYLVGTVAARNVIDIVRAARHLPAAHALDHYAVWGHSEGGQAAMFALKIAPSYAPGLRLTGVVASAPPSELQLIYDRLDSLDSSDRGYWLMLFFGFNVAYGSQAPLDQVLTPLGRSLKPAVENGCSVKILGTVQRYPLDKLVKADPFSVPAWKKLLLANDPGQFGTASPAPLLILQGGNDTIVPAASTKILAGHLCGTGQDLERWVYPGQSHAGVIREYLPDMTTWLSHRFSGGPDPDPMTPGVSGVSITRCG